MSVGFGFKVGHKITANGLVLGVVGELEFRLPITKAQ
jgi:hypothetical protein